MTGERWGKPLTIGMLAAAVLAGSACDPKVRALAEVQPLQGSADEDELARDDGSPDAGRQDLGSSELVDSPPLIDEQTPVASGDQEANASCTGDAGACGGLGDAGTSLSCPGCVIEDDCVGAYIVDPSNPCLICDPERSTSAWSPNDGVLCEDGLFCTTDDECIAGVCAGSPWICEDGVACNGVSTCDEDEDQCSADENQCGANAICNVESDECVSTCSGCLVGGVCVAAGTEQAGNPCMVCDPARSTVAFSAATGKSCGAGPTACSAQDTCDAQGRCQPNHLPPSAACGNPASSACDQPDTCDGNGNCSQRLAANGTACNDGAFCTIGDRCQGGACVPTGNFNCGANQSCNEGSNQCQCQGCRIGGDCLPAGAVNPTNPCQICDPSRNSAAFSVNANAPCGGGLVCGMDAQCKSPLGGDCRENEDCVTSQCDFWYRDADGDGHGTPTQLTGTCGTGSNSVRPAGFVASSDDCCDASSLIFSGQVSFFDEPQTVCPNVDPYDYNCDGRPEDQLNGRTGQGQFNSCDVYFPETCVGQVWGSDANCGQRADVLTCGRATPDAPCRGLLNMSGQLIRTFATVQCR